MLSAYQKPAVPASEEEKNPFYYLFKTYFYLYIPRIDL